MCEDFWQRLALELDMMIGGTKTPKDIVSRIYMLVEEIPAETCAHLRAAFDEFHYYAANYEPDSNIRSIDPGLIGETDFKKHASKFLAEIKNSGLISRITRM